jgi:hypothetical protein
MSGSKKNSRMIALVTRALNNPLTSSATILLLEVDVFARFMVSDFAF